MAARAGHCGNRTPNRANLGWVDQEDSVVGYYALAAHRVAREDVPTKIGRGGPTEIPAVLLARLALSAQDS